MLLTEPQIAHFGQEQFGFPVDHFAWEQLHPTFQALPLFAVHQLTPLSGDNLHGGRSITRRQRMLQRFLRVPVLRQPGAGFDVQRANFRRAMLLRQLLEQEFLKQRMITKPVALVIQRCQKQISLLQPFQSGVTITLGISRRP